MRKSKYKKWMTESFLYEAEKFKARSKESGKIVYYKTKDAMDAAIKDKKAEPIEKGDDKEKKNSVGMDIDASAGLGGDSGIETPQVPKDGKAALDISNRIDDFERKGKAGLYDLLDKYDLEEDDVYDLKNIGFDFNSEGDSLDDEQMAIMQDRFNQLSTNAKKALKAEFMSDDKQKDESFKVINGKKYKRVDESLDRRVTVKEVRSWLKKLEEFRYRKIRNVDARRVTSFINSNLSETDLPSSLQKKWEHAKYGREKHFADKFNKEKISQKWSEIAQNEGVKMKNISYNVQTGATTETDTTALQETDAEALGIFSFLVALLLMYAM